MMGLTDRLESWTRRFQRAPARPAAEPEPGRPSVRTGRFARPDRDAPAEPVARPTGRFARRALQEQER
jgi:hypothetical protein